MDATTLAGRHTVDELTDMAAEIRATERVPVEELERTGDIWLYPPDARKKLNEIAWAITYHLRRDA